MSYEKACEMLDKKVAVNLGIETFISRRERKRKIRLSGRQTFKTTDHVDYISS